MTMLKDRLAQEGSFLFRWRSFLPFILIVPALAALPQSGTFEYVLGESAEAAWDVFCVLIAFSGLALRIATVGTAPAGTSGRNTQGQRADQLNTSGLYSVVRNPLYLANLVTALGFLLAIKVWWVSILALSIGVIYYERIIIAEEQFLLAKFGRIYQDWVQRTPVWWPNVRLWKRPDLPFSAKSVIRREYHGFYLIVVVMTVIEMLTDVIGENIRFADWLADSPGWIAFFVSGTAIYVVIRLIRKTTGWLAVEGR